MKIAEFKRYKHHEEYSIWLRLYDEKMEFFRGSIIEYKAQGRERHLISLMFDSMRVALTLAGYEIIGGV